MSLSAQQEKKKAVFLSQIPLSWCKVLSENMRPRGNPSTLAFFLMLLPLGLLAGRSARDVVLLGSEDSELCDYDPCRDQQRPCAELSEQSACRCPGLSGPDEPPEAPFLKTLTQEGPGILVRWCAPASSVSQYRVLAEGHEPVVLGPLSRRASLLRLEPGTSVCVEAANVAGASAKTANSCAHYEPSGDGGSALKAGLIVGGLGLLLLLLSLLGVLLWKRHSGRKSGAGGPTRDSDGPL